VGIRTCNSREIRKRGAFSKEQIQSNEDKDKYRGLGPLCDPVNILILSLRYFNFNVNSSIMFINSKIYFFWFIWPKKDVQNFASIGEIETPASKKYCPM